MSGLPLPSVCSASVLRIFELDLITIVDTDASVFVIGAD